MNCIWLARRSGRMAFDGNRQITRVGLPAVTPGGMTLVEAVENFWYPGLHPVAGLAITGGSSIRQFNDPDLSVELTYSVTKGTYALASIVIDSSENLENGTGFTQSGLYHGVAQQNIQRTFTLSAFDTQGAAAVAHATLTWQKAIYYGSHPLSPSELLGVLALDRADQLGFAHVLATTKALNHNFNCSGGRYIYVLYPAEFGDPVVVRTGMYDFSAYGIAETPLIDPWRHQLDYKLFYTGYQTGDDININIIS